MYERKTIEKVVHGRGISYTNCCIVVFSFNLCPALLLFLFTNYAQTDLDTLSKEAIISRMCYILCHFHYFLYKIIEISFQWL